MSGTRYIFWGIIILAVVIWAIAWMIGDDGSDE
jgi:hypothetical protein